MQEDHRTHAEESVAPKFTRHMRATTSPLGMFTDPPVVAVFSAVTVMTAMGLAMRLDGPVVHGLLAALALAPLATALLVFVKLGNTRATLVDWLAGLPFAVENMNGLLNGVALHIRIRFVDTRPPKQELNEALESVHTDCFAMEFEQDGELEVEVKIGVLDSKLNPTRAHYHRFHRVQRLIDEVLVPMAREHPIQDVWIA